MRWGWPQGAVATLQSKIDYSLGTREKEPAALSLGVKNLPVTISESDQVSPEALNHLFERPLESLNHYFYL